MHGLGAGRRHAAIIRQLYIPRPFGLTRFLRLLEIRRGRPILLRPFTAGPEAPCGLWISTGSADYILHEQGTSSFHQTLIVLHEVAHMLLGHGTPDLGGLLAPGLDPVLVTVILGRSAYRTAEEREAETLASRILARAAIPAGSAARAIRSAAARDASPGRPEDGRS